MDLFALIRVIRGEISLFRFFSGVLLANFLCCGGIGDDAQSGDVVGVEFAHEVDGLGVGKAAGFALGEGDDGPDRIVELAGRRIDTLFVATEGRAGQAKLNECFLPGGIDLLTKMRDSGPHFLDPHKKMSAPTL